jgi:hypothetical protein
MVSQAFDKLRSLVESPRTRGVAMTAGGLLALLGGRKVTALGLFSKGLHGLEKEWHLAHPDFEGGFTERWQKALEFYDTTHRDPVNRKLHIIGIPFIVAGSAGLLLFPAYRPLWGVSAAAFVGGWALNFIGHGFFEKNAPAFADDPLSFVAGPVWDFQQLFAGKKTNGVSEDAPAERAADDGGDPGRAPHATA